MTRRIQPMCHRPAGCLQLASFPRKQELQAGSLHHKVAVLCGAGILPAICRKMANLQIPAPVFTGVAFFRGNDEDLLSPSSFQHQPSKTLMSFSKLEDPGHDFLFDASNHPAKPMLLHASQPLPRTFYARPTRTVACELLGCRLVRQLNGVRLSGVIVEAEAYIGESDLACHAKAGKTPRTAVMYGSAGFSYVYFTYGMHWMLNVVTEEKDFPAAVLLRAIEPLEGIEEMRRLRGGKDLRLLGRGPACLTQALGITRAENGLDLCVRDSGLWIEQGETIPKRNVAVSPRIGLGKTPEPWLSKPWRYFMAGSAFVSR